MDQARLFRKRLTEYLDGTLLPEHQTQFHEWLVSGQYDDLIAEAISARLHQRHAEEIEMQPQRAEEILKKIIDSEQQTVQLIPKKRKWRSTWLVAASVLFLIATTYWLMPIRSKTTSENHALAGIQTITKKNSSSSPQLIQLADGSNITLQPGSSIEYPKNFAQEKREVQLKGEAFFQVAKDAKRPFYVYAGKIVTHVLGTSFLVKQDAKSGRYEVAVRTGRVEVFEQLKKSAEKTSDRYSSGVVLVPNQKVVYTEESRQFISSLVENPQPIIEEEEGKLNKSKPIFEYHAAKLGVVLQDLEETYGIDFELERDALNLCQFTGNIQNYDLFTKLDLITGALKANYEIKGTRILIKGQGCTNNE